MNSITKFSVLSFPLVALALFQNCASPAAPVPQTISTSQCSEVEVDKSVEVLGIKIEFDSV